MTDELHTKIAELEKEVEYLKKRAFGFGSFSMLSGVEDVKAKAFFAEHKMHGQPGRMVFNPSSSVTWCYTSTPCGSIIELKCRCGKSEDITDFDCW